MKRTHSVASEGGAEEIAQSVTPRPASHQDEVRAAIAEVRRRRHAAMAQATRTRRHS